MTRTSVLVFSAVVFFWLVPARNNSRQTGIPAPHPQAGAVKMVPDTLPAAIPQRIPWDIFEFQPARFSTKPGKEAVLRKLFPGHFYTYAPQYGGTDSVSFVVWTSPRSTKKGFPGASADDGTLLFPLDSGNQTLIKDFIPFTDGSGVQHIVVSFSSTEIVQDLLFTGRFSCAVLGLALLSENKGAWELSAFSPGMGCYGSFQTIPKLHLQKINKTDFGYSFEDINGGAGGPYYGNLFLFAQTGDHFRQVLAKSGTTRTGSKEGWETTLQCVEGAGDEIFPDLKLITSGNYSLTEFKATEDDTANIPPGINAYSLRNNKFHFEIYDVYRYSNGQYVFYSEEVGVR